ncbi:MAG TPA: alpha/beta fold hydrolase [Pseudonocardiaceae bacterium]|nr:alpha/beta fold hydrolase [Pseudonocardiaceae bacterium]
MSDWIRVFRPAPGAAHRLVCFPHAGGSASYYRPFALALPPSVEALCVQYPGRQDRLAEPVIADMHELADQVAAELRPWLDRPTAFFGHSMGATLAFEAALRLADTGRVVCLFASGRTAPSRQRAKTVHLRDDDGLLAEVRKLSDIDPALLADPEIAQLILPSLRGDYRAAETYRHVPGRLLDCPVVALVGDADTEVDEAEARAWADHTTGPFACHVFTGGHFYLADALPELARLVDSVLD